MMESKMSEEHIREEKIEKKYVNRLIDNNSLGFKFCKIDECDLDVVRKIFTTGLGYYITSNGKYLNWE